MTRASKIANANPATLWEWPTTPTVTYEDVKVTKPDGEVKTIKVIVKAFDLEGNEWEGTTPPHIPI